MYPVNLIMNKEAKTDHDIHPLISKRWSPRAFSDKPVETEILLRLFEAARWSPSSSNQQPWSFIVGIKGDATYNNIFSSLVEFNQLWAKFAPILIVSCGRKISEKDQKLNKSFAYDVGQAVAYLSVQAMVEGLYVHQMGGFETSELTGKFEIPDIYEPLTVIAIGYIGDPEILHPNQKRMELDERKRKKLNEFIFSGKFSEPSTLLQKMTL